MKKKCQPPSFNTTVTSSSQSSANTKQFENNHSYPPREILAARLGLYGFRSYPSPEFVPTLSCIATTAGQRHYNWYMVSITAYWIGLSHRALLYRVEDEPSRIIPRHALLRREHEAQHVDDDKQDGDSLYHHAHLIVCLEDVVKAPPKGRRGSHIFLFTWPWPAS